jgi:membrane protease YdiL (CAAX protease family)
MPGVPPIRSPEGAPENPRGEGDPADGSLRDGPSIPTTVGMLFLLVLAMVVGDRLAGAVLPATATATTRLLLSLCIAWPVVLWVVRRRQRASFRVTFSIRGIPPGPLLMSALSGLALGVVTVSLMSHIPGPPPASATELHEVVAASNRISLLVAMLLVAPVCEELFFRGWMLPVWTRHLGPMGAVLGVAFLFSILHVFDWRVVVALPLGVLAGWLVLKLDSVLPAIAAHAASNAAPRLVDPMLRLRGLSPEEIDALRSVPWWLSAVAALTLIGCLGVVSAVGHSGTSPES